MDTREDSATQKVAFFIYCMYIGSVVLPMMPFLAVVFAYVFENDARDFLKSHYQQMIRSFWMAMLYFSISIILIPLLVGIALVPLCIVWWLIRNVKGLKSLLRNEPIANPKTWWV